MQPTAVQKRHDQFPDRHSYACIDVPVSPRRGHGPRGQADWNTIGIDMTRQGEAFNWLLRLLESHDLVCVAPGGTDGQKGTALLKVKAAELAKAGVTVLFIENMHSRHLERFMEIETGEAELDDFLKDDPGSGIDIRKLLKTEPRLDMLRTFIHLPGAPVNLRALGLECIGERKLLGNREDLGECIRRHRDKCGATKMLMLGYPDQFLSTLDGVKIATLVHEAEPIPR